MDDTSKRHRMDIMDDYLASIGQRRKPIPKDGSSLFRSVSEQLFSTQAYHVKVRDSCVDHMRRHQEEFEHFIDISFDDYLERMSNTKEWGDQLEISALSQYYRCDFYIYDQPGQAAKNVTENFYEKRIYLCHSGQKHYDCVYPLKFFISFGICQAIVNSILLTKVLGASKNDEKKLVQTFRMLSCTNSDAQKEKRNRHQVQNFPLPSIYEPSIGNLDQCTPIESQFGLAFQLPYSLDFIRSLDPSVFRNIDYDFWITIKRRQQFIDSSIAEGLQYCIGDRCLVCLNIYSKPLYGHVQEISPNNGPITVFLEALVGKHTVAVKNVKPLDYYSDSNNSRKYRRLSNGKNDYNRNRSDEDFQNRFKSRSRNPSSFQRYKWSNFQYSSDYYPSRQDNYRKSRRNCNGRSECNKSRTDEEIQNRMKSRSKNSSNFQRHRYSHQYSSDCPPSRLLEQLSLCQDDHEDEDSWPQNPAEYTESSISIPPFPKNVGEWEEENWERQEPAPCTNYDFVEQQNELRDTAEHDREQREQSSSEPSVDFVQPSENFAHYGIPYPNLPPAGSIPPQRPICAPYTGNITLLDCDGKELVLVDDKNPFQYFYNLGVEFYRQLNVGNPRTVPVFYGPSVPPNVYGSPPVVHPQPMISSTGTPQFIGPSVTPAGNCIPMHHFHPIVSPPQGRAVHVPVPPGHVLVHIPPAPRPPIPPAIPLSTADPAYEHHVTDEAGSPNHEPYESNGQSCASQGSTSGHSVPNYVDVSPIFHPPTQNPLRHPLNG